jgi:ribosomal-protein-alanine N-acetyltransferase
VEPWVIEPMDPARDVEAVLEVERLSFLNPWTREMLLWELEHSGVAHVYVLRTAEAPVAAYCSFWLVFDELHVNNLAVRPEYRRRGMGRALLARVLAEGARRGARRATLEVRRSNTAAINLYLQLGFVVAGTRPNYYTDPVEDALILWRDPIEPQDTPAG